MHVFIQITNFTFDRWLTIFIKNVSDKLHKTKCILNKLQILAKSKYLSSYFSQLIFFFFLAFLLLYQILIRYLSFYYLFHNLGKKKKESTLIQAVATKAGTTPFSIINARTKLLLYKNTCLYYHTFFFNIAVVCKIDFSMLQKTFLLDSLSTTEPVRDQCYFDYVQTLQKYN